MVRIFISYAEEDASYCRSLVVHLNTISNVTTWERSLIIPGQNITCEIDSQLQTADIFLLLISPDFIGSRTCQNEQNIALERRGIDTIVIPIIIRSCNYSDLAIAQLNLSTLPSRPFSEYPSQDDAYTEIIEGIRHVINSRSIPVIPETPNPECPYQGLESFTEDTKQYFFGRSEVLTAVENSLKTSNVVLISGSSGVGKSSFTQACLVPKLRREGWKIPRINSIKPGFDPSHKLRVIIEELFREVNGNIIEFENWWEDLTNAIDRNLIKTAEQANQYISQLTNARTIFVVDQFEEIFTICKSDRERDLFINIIYMFALADRSARIFVVINMRADFDILLRRYPQTATLNHLGKIDIIPLSQLEGRNLEEAITLPANAALTGCGFEPDLIERIKNDIRTENCLPLLQFALKEMWEQCFNGIQKDLFQNNRFSIANYDKIGGLKASLNNQAERIYKDLNDDLKKDMAEHLFLQLVRTNEDSGDTRVRKLKTDILNSIRLEDRKAINQVLDIFIERRLLVIDECGLVDLAHETLIESWIRFKNWCIENRDLRRIVEQTKHAYESWKKNNEMNDFLLSPSLIVQIYTITSFFTTPSNEQKDKASKLFKALENEAGLKPFYEKSYSNYSRLQKSEIQELERDAKEGQKNLNSLEPLKGLREILEVVKKWKKYKPNDALPGSIQNALRLAMESSREKNCFSGHTDKVKCVAISHDGKWIISGSEDYTIRLWNYQGKCCAIFTGHNAGVWSVAFAPDNSWFISGSADHKIKRWRLDENAFSFDCTNGTQIGQDFTGHSDWVRSVLISPDGQQIVSASKDQTIKIWSLNGEIERDIKSAHEDWIFSIAMWQDQENPENGYIVSGSADKTLKRWDLNGEPLDNIHVFNKDHLGNVFNKEHKGWIRSVAIANNGKLIISSSEDNTIRFWDLTGTCIKVLEGHTNRILSIDVWQKLERNVSGKFIENSGFIASGSADHTVCLWDFNGDLIGQPFKGHTDWIRNVKISAQGDFIASASRDMTLRTWDLNGGNLIKKVFDKPDGQEITRILSVAFSSDSQFIAAGGEEKRIRLWNLDGSIREGEFEEHDDWIRSLRILPDNQHIVSGCADKKLHLWNVDGTFIEAKYDEHNSWIRSIAISPDGERIVSSSNDKTLCLWKIDRSEAQIRIQAEQCFSTDCHTKEVLSVAFSPDGKYIASSSADRSIKIWRLDGKLERTIYPAHQDRVLSVAFSPDGKYIASASYDNTVCVWYTESGTEKWRSKLEDKVRSVAFSPKNEFPLLVSGSRDGTLQFWSVENGDKIGMAFKGHQEVVRSVKFSHDGKHFISASDDGNLCLWEAGNWKDWFDICCDRVRDYSDFKENE